MLALALRLAYVFQVKGSSLLLPQELDPGFYFNWAKEIAAGQLIGHEPFVQSPLYAYLLAAFIRIFGTGLTPILVAQSIVGVGTTFLTYIAGRRYFGPRHGLLAAFLLALYAPFIFYEGMVMKTFLSPFLTILLVLLLHRAREKSRALDAAPIGGRSTAGAFALAGLVFGLLTLDRDNFIILLPPLMMLAFVLAGGRGRRGGRAAAAFALGAAIAIVPVTLRNYAVSHEFVLLTTGGGEVFYIGNNPDANGLYVPPPFVRPDPKYEHADFVARASEISGRDLTPMQSSWFWLRQGLGFIADQPLQWVHLLWMKFARFWNWYELPDNIDYAVMQWFSPILDHLDTSFPPPGMPTLAVPTTVGWLPLRLHLYSVFGLLAPLGILGLLRSRARWRELLPLHLLLFGYMGTVMLFFNFSRFRVPVVPILALFASEGLMALGAFARRGWELAVAFAGRTADLTGRLRALVPDSTAAVNGSVFFAALLFVNVEYPRGVVPAIEQALSIGNAYYADGRPEEARQSYYRGMVLLGEGPEGPAGDELLKGFGPGVTRAALLKELEIESVARGPEFKGIHVGIHHGLGIALVLQAQALLDQGKRGEAMGLLGRAVDQFHEALRLAPSYLLSHRKLARAYELKGDTAQAVDWLRKAVDLWPEDMQARLELAELLYNTGDYDAALSHIETAAHYNPGMEKDSLAQLYYNRALVFLNGRNDKATALYDFEKTLEIDPVYPRADAIRETVRRLRQSGVPPQVDAAMERALQPSPPAPARSPGAAPASGEAPER